MTSFGTTSNTLIELTAADGVTIIPLMLVKVTPTKAASTDTTDTTTTNTTTAKGEKPYSLEQALSASNADSPLAEWLEPQIQETWIGGAGGGKVGYAQAPGVDTRFDGYAFPGPAANPVTIVTANNSDSRIVAIKQYGAAVFFAQEGTSTANTPRVMRAATGSASLADSLGGASAFPVAANNSLTDLLVFDNGLGSKYLWASGNDGTGGRLHYFDGSTWTSTASGTFGSNRRDWLAKVFWKTLDGNAGWRMIAGNGNNKISYTRANADPSLAASWVEGVLIETAGRIWKAATARRHAYFPGQDGLFDMDETGDTPNLAPYLEKQIHGFNGYASLYHDGYIYMSTGMGMERIYVGDGGLIQEGNDQCGPGAFTEAEHEYGGFVTNISLDQNWIVSSVFNPNTLRTGIWWSRDRKHYPGVETANPLIHHGPIITSTGNQFVTTTEIVTDLTTNVMQLWVASIAYSASTLYTGAPTLTYFTLPAMGSPLSDLLTSGNHKFANGAGGGAWQPYSRLYGLPKTWGDKNSKKIIYLNNYGTRGLDVATSTKLTTYGRADPAPGSTAWGTGVDVTTGPVQALTPATTTTGYKLERRVDFFAPNGASTPPKVPVLDAERIDAWRVVPAFPVYTLDVQYGSAVSDLYGGTDDGAIDDTYITALLEELTRSDRTVMRLPTDSRRSVKLRQVMDVTVVYKGSRRQVTARLQIADLGAAS